MYEGHNPNSVGGIYALCRNLVGEFRPTTILDLGARYGEGFELFGEATMRCDGQYICVEPSPRCIPNVEAMISRHSGWDIKLIPGVLGNAPGTVSLNILDSDGDQSANIFTDRAGRYGKATPVDVQVFDYSHIPDEIDFAKVNIEGAEYGLIDDGLFNRFSMFVLEAHNEHVPGMTYKNVISALQNNFRLVTHGNLNYKYCFITGVRL